jgi:hypothetical protein
MDFSTLLNTVNAKIAKAIGKMPKKAGTVTGNGKRRDQRFAALGLTCVIGEVQDVSLSGLRIRCRGWKMIPKDDVLHLAVATDRQRVQCSVRVVWRRLKGIGVYEVGLQYVDTSRGARAAIVQMARYGFVGQGQETPQSSPETPPPNATSGAAGDTPPACPPLVEVEDLYKILGVSHAASEDDVRRAYRDIARTCHPDVCNTPESQEKFSMASKAYSVLRDADARKRYDSMLRGSRAA